MCRHLRRTVPGGHFLLVVRGKERGYNEGADETKGGGEDGKSEKQRTIAGDQAAHVPPRTHSNPREGGTLTGMAAASTGGTSRSNKDEGKHTGGACRCCIVSMQTSMRLSHEALFHAHHTFSLFIKPASKVAHSES